jgi:glycosyltransferase involved in cell wall biosynthesis
MRHRTASAGCRTSMTVAFDVGPLKPNPAGVGIYVRSLARGLDKVGRTDLIYLGLRPDAAGLPTSVPSIERSSRVPYSMWVELIASWALRSSGASLAHFTDGLVPIIRRQATIVTVLDLSLVRHWRSHRVVRYARIPLVLAAPRLADRVIAISQATADEVVRLSGTPARKIEVIPLAPRASARPAPDAVVQAVASRYGLARGAYLLVPGTIEPRKNHLRVLAAFEDLVRRRVIPLETQLVLAGQAGWKAERTLAAFQASDVTKRIKVLGYVPEDELAALMTGAAAVAYASTYEGFGLPVLEAMACGAAVVTSNVSSMPEVAGDAAVLVDPFDPASIAAGIESALSGSAPSRDASIARAARFTWAETAKRTAAIYDLLA